MALFLGGAVPQTRHGSLRSGLRMATFLHHSVVITTYIHMYINISAALGYDKPSNECSPLTNESEFPFP
jgi:hypothetical protein